MMKGSRPLTDEEIRAILSALALSSFPRRNQALFLLGLRAGFRISELLSLRVGDVIQNGNLSERVTVQRRYMKKKVEGRTVLLHPEAREAIRLWVEELRKDGLEDGETFLFRSREGGNRPISRTSAWHTLSKAYAVCGLTGKLGTHCMRKTFAKRMHEKLGRDLMKTQKALGHARVTSTVSYLSFNENEIDDAILKS